MTTRKICIQHHFDGLAAEISEAYKYLKTWVNKTKSILMV